MNKVLFEATTSNSVKKSVTERIKTFEDACRELNISKVAISIDGIDDDAESIASYAKLIIIARALNEGWVPDWKNKYQYKYFPWFIEKPGFGLSFLGYVNWKTDTAVGSRLCFKSMELAEYAAKQFATEYIDFLTIKK